MSSLSNMSGLNLEMSSYSHMDKFEKRKNTKGCLQVPKNFLNGKTPLYTLIYFLSIIHSIMPSYQLPILERMACLGIIFCIALVIAILVDCGVV